MRLWEIYAPEIPPCVRAAWEAPAMARIMRVGMNCGCEYTSFPLFARLREGYSRFDHSVGAALIVWRFARDERQTLAALFHDIATPCFAHVVDFMLGDSMKQEATEGATARIIAESIDLQSALTRMGLTTDDVADYHRFPIADNDSPRLSSDRLEYTLGNFVNYRLGSRAQAREFMDDLIVTQNEDGETELAFMHADTARAFARAALQMGKIYVSPEARFTMHTLSELLREAIAQGAIADQDLWGTEDALLKALCAHPQWRERWRRFCAYSRIVPAAQGRGQVIYSKKRYINPLVAGMGRVTEIDEAFAHALAAFLNESQDAPLDAE